MQDHWNNVYNTKPAHCVSWFQREATRSLEWIKAAAKPPAASIIDVGGGASTLVNDLLATGYEELTVLDLADAALSVTRRRLGEAARYVSWLVADITTVELPPAAYDVWHDRAVFHFLTEPRERHAYVQRLDAALKPEGHLILATFGERGPAKCSGLPIIRYTADSLGRELGSRYRLVAETDEMHETPAGAEQHFIYCHFVRGPG